MLMSGTDTEWDGESAEAPEEEAMSPSPEAQQLLTSELDLSEKFAAAIKIIEEKDKELSLAGRIGTILVNSNKRFEEESKELRDKVCTQYAHRWYLMYSIV